MSSTTAFKFMILGVAIGWYYKDLKNLNFYNFNSYQRLIMGFIV